MIDRGSQTMITKWDIISTETGFRLLTLNNFCECLIRNAMPLFSFSMFPCRSLAITCTHKIFSSIFRKNVTATVLLIASMVMLYKHQWTSKWTSGAHFFGPDDMWSKHCGKINCWHLVDVLIAGSVVQQIQEQFQQAAIGCRKQHEKQLICLYLSLFVRHTCLISLIIKASQFWKQQIRELSAKEQECL